jgi:phosphoglycolate phosphatase
MPISLIIFDLDGTLVDSASDIQAAVNYAIYPYGLPPVTLQETKASIGEGVTILIEKLLALKGAESLDRKRLTERFLEYYSSHFVDNTIPYPDVPETLERLSAFSKAVISNKLTDLAEKVLSTFGLLKHFALVAGGDSSSEKKPSPMPVLRALSFFHVGQDEALMVGDSIFDITAGHAAGLKTVAVTYGYGTQGFSEDADFVINRFSQLIEIVRSLN